MTSAGPMPTKPRWSDGITGYHYIVLAVACFGWSFDTMDQWLYVFVKQHAIRELLGPGATEAAIKVHIGYVQTALIVGWATGGLFFGMIGDWLGRTRTMAITILMYAGFTGLSGLAHTWEQFALLRFLVGLGVGGEFAAGAALVAETFPDHSRATALSIVQATSALGNVSAGVINLITSSYFDPATSWRWVFAIGVLPALLVFVIFLFVREPEKWRTARAQAKLHKGSTGNILALFREPILRRNTLVGLTLAAVGVIGFWGISTFSPELLRSALNPANLSELKKSVEQQVSIVGMAQNLGSFFGALFFAWLAQRIGRRPAFFVALLACLIEIPCTFYFTNSFLSALIGCFGMGFVLLFLLGGFAVYFPELFPTRLRATGTGFCYNVARYISAIFPSLFGNLAGVYGIQRAALMLSTIFLLGMLALPFAPETKDKPLME